MLILGISVMVLIISAIFIRKIIIGISERQKLESLRAEKVHRVIIDIPAEALRQKLVIEECLKAMYSLIDNLHAKSSENDHEDYLLAVSDTQRLKKKCDEAYIKIEQFRKEQNELIVELEKTKSV